MTKLTAELYAEIEKGLRAGWMQSQQGRIKKEVEEIKGTDGRSQALRFQKREALEKVVSDEFEECWNTIIKPQVIHQCSIFSQKIETQLLERHPWLEHEEESQSKYSLKDHFLLETLKSFLFDFLEKKPTGVKTWEKIPIDNTTEFTWKEINETVLTSRIQGYPLSNITFYDDRPLPSYLDAPFDRSPMRYDLYRLLIKSYDDKFKPKKNASGVFCTQIAPLHYNELGTLSEKEWDYLETMLVNIGTEPEPEWVLLENKKGTGTLYVPPFWEEKCRSIPALNKFTIHTVTHSTGAVYSPILDWHAVLLSRVLPWSQLPQAQKPSLNAYRATVPISVLFQNTLESSCLKAQNKNENASKKAFAKGYPLSARNERQLYSDPTEPQCLLPNISETLAHIVIDAFDTREIAYNPAERQLSITKETQFIEGMKLAYHQHIQKLVITTPPQESLKHWFSYNLELTTIDSPNSPEYEYSHACAARNRFLAKFNPDYLKNAPHEMEARQLAWPFTGRFIYDFFKNNADDLQSKNIAEMGREGLEVFFTHLNELKEPANLSCTLDLDSGNTCDKRDYIHLLTNKIRLFDKKSLFSQLNLVLPSQLGGVTDAFVDLISVLNERGEIKEVNCHNPMGITHVFLENLIKFVEEDKICLQIKIPAWDDTTCSDSEKGLLKAKYRKLQNTILTNIRQAREGELNANTATINAPLPVAYPLKLKSSQLTEEDESWKEGVTYPLASASVGIQQQAQQEVAQEVQQEAEQQSKPKTPVARDIQEYTGNEPLITRDNLKQHGISPEDFSSWVGSHTNAAFVIQKMDPAALKQIKACPSLFKFGLDAERTPGFRLCYASHHDKTLILTFDEALVDQDIEDQKLDPFAIQMNDSKPATPFCGDYRQWAPIAYEQKKELTLWRHLATETVPEPIKTWLNHNQCNIETSESMQYHNVNQTTERASDQSEMISTIKQWSKINDEAFLSALLDDLTPENLRAFGQLFYHYDTKGNQHWLNLAHQVYLKFPTNTNVGTDVKTTFSIFKERLLVPLNDWSECLEKSEVDAITASMQKLAQHPIYQNILWSLIDSHGETVGRMRYAEVWRAYDMVIDYINANDLEINEEEFLNAIQNYQGQFNATQFLRRVYGVLQHTGNRQDSGLVQQDILNHLSAIDWRENGFYYACVHEHYRYWDDALELHDVLRLDGGQPPSYISTWDEIDLSTISNPVGYTLRYAAQRLKLNKRDFDQFKQIITQVSEQCPHHTTALMRLITTSIALGLDTVEGLSGLDWTKFDVEAYQNGLQRINQEILLDSKELVNRSYHVRMEDLPVLLAVLNETKLAPLDLDTINALGRALQCYPHDKKGQLQKLIQYGLTHGFNAPLITAYPWLVDAPIESPPDGPECITFYKQLRSIDFSHSTLPDNKTLTQALRGIDSREDRHSAVNMLINQKCLIIDQDAEYVVLGADKSHMIDDLYLSKTFQAQNRSLLKTLFMHLAIKQEGNTDEKIKGLLQLFSELDRKNYYDELGQLLGLLVEQSQDGQYYSVEQLTLWLKAVFDETAFKTKPYPVAFIKALLSDALKDKSSSLLNQDLHHLKMKEDNLDPLKTMMSQTNLSDLPDQAKKTLVQCAIQFKRDPGLNSIISRYEAVFNQLKKSPQVTTALCDFITTQLVRDAKQLVSNLDVLEKLTLPYSNREENELIPLWESNQIKLLDGLKTGVIDDDKVKALVSIADPYIRMILIEALTDTDQMALIHTVKAQLDVMSKDERIKLATYFTSEPKPTLRQLHTLLTQQTSAAMINQFEMVMQAEGKRNYSLDENDAVAIERVLNGFKLKKQDVIAHSEQTELLNLLYYTNTYSQVMSLKEKSDDDLLHIIKQNKKESTPAAKARILACMREVTLRKTGKWVNHTQMIALLYSALHNDDNLIHQIRMGEGKSIVSLMRVAYRALNGQTVDIFSSKESLSLRDHQDSLAVLDAFRIRHSHITANSEPDQYYTTVEHGVGAVHYATIGNWSLFLSGVRWGDKDSKFYLDMNANNRVAFLDEGDHIMLSENTLFNFSDQTGASSIYNFDAWVYQVTYDFYLKNKDKFEQDGTVSEIPDLQTLYSLLQEAAQTIAPEKSSFFQKYLASGDVVLRNKKLVGLLTAAHLSEDLKEGVDFCVMNEQKKISDSTTIDTRFAKVMINNQVYHGSTYSDLVQQFLHVRLNKQAVEAHQPPNFFVEPESEIVLSLNATYVLKHYYKHIEAYTGTARGEEALHFYKDELGIYRVVKIPTHQDIKSEFLPPIYCVDLEQQVAQIVASIRANPDQPILITCEDDKAVEALGILIQKALGNDRGMVIDTNAKGLSEADILKKAGLRGAITISSRLGRGSDIRPYDTVLGLKVLRTYPATPEVVKQEYGRQGRNGAGGVCQDIINYGSVLDELKQYQDTNDFITLLEYERQHLETKLEKHTKRNNDQSKQIWVDIGQDEKLKEKYLSTRTLQTFKQQNKEKNKRMMGQKDELLIEGSAYVMEHLRGLSVPEKSAFKEAWKACKKSIETHWTDDLEGQTSRDMLTEFYTQHRMKQPQLSKKIRHSEPERTDAEGSARAPIKEQILFYQNWLNNLCQSHFKPDEAMVHVIYGAEGEHLDTLYQAFQKLNVEQLAILTELVNKYPACHTISSKAWATAIDLLVENQDSSEIYNGRLNDFFAKNQSTPNNVREVEIVSQSFIAAIEGAPDIEFIKQIIEDEDFEEKDYLLNTVQKFPKEVVDLCQNYMNKEDIVFFLNTLVKSKSDDSLGYFVRHYKALKAYPDVIRPLIPLLLQSTQQTLLETLIYSDKTAALLRFLSKRPHFETKDYQDMQTKINGLQEQEQFKFLSLLSRIPPYISVRKVLKDLSDLPGKYSFLEGNNDLHNRIDQIYSATTAFNDFLFDHDLITSKSLFEHPNHDDAYAIWQDIFSKLSLDRGETFFTSMKALNHLDLDQLKNLADRYANHQSNKTLQADMNQLLQSKKMSEATKPASSQVAQASFFKRF